MNLKVPRVALLLEESMSVIVHLSLTCYLSKKYDCPYPAQACTPEGSFVKFIVPYLTRSKPVAL